MKHTLTWDDMIISGACPEGVVAVLERLPQPPPAAVPLDDVLAVVSADEWTFVLKAADRNGYGYGYGYGDGYSNGNGDGYGYGHGYGDGHGHDGNGDGGVTDAAAKVLADA